MDLKINRIFCQLVELGRIKVSTLQKSKWVWAVAYCGPCWAAHVTPLSSSCGLFPSPTICLETQCLNFWHGNCNACMNLLKTLMQLLGTCLLLVQACFGIALGCHFILQLFLKKGVERKRPGKRETNNGRSGDRRKRTCEQEWYELL